MNHDQRLAKLHADLGFQRLNRSWARLEIVLGLTAAGAGLFLGVWAVQQVVDAGWPYLLASLFLFVLGGYLAMAGHRSHLYQSNNELAAYLAEEFSAGKQVSDGKT